MGRVLRILPSVDYKRLPLTPAEGNVFTRIDGVRPEEEIVRLTGYHVDTVARALSRLIELGAAEDLAVLAAREAQEREAIVVDRLAFGGLDAKAPPIYDAKELDEDGELDPAKKKQVLDAFYRLDKLNYYELLGVHQLADKKQIKSAYYQIAPDFHPDKYFRKNLGFFRSKIEAIFARLTIAHDTLQAREKRAEYDDYLATQEQTRSADQILGSTQRAIQEAQAAIEQRARAAASSDDPKAQAILAERRKALAAKLSGGLGRAGIKRDDAKQTVDPKAAAEALRVRYEMARSEAQKAQIQRYIESGRSAAEQGSWAAAANAYRIAASLAPNDENLKREAAEIQQQAAAKLADGFMKQGEYESAQERWVEAAISYSKACQGRPDDAKAHDKAAHATFRARNNPRRALELAKRAVELAADQVLYRVTLSYCFMAAGMDQSAFAELERAAKGSKDNEVLKRAIDHAHEALSKGRYSPQESLFEREAKDHRRAAGSLSPNSMRQGQSLQPAPAPRATTPPAQESTSIAVSHDNFSVAQGVQALMTPVRYQSHEPTMRDSSPGLSSVSGVLPAFVPPPPGSDPNVPPWSQQPSYPQGHQAIHPPPPNSFAPGSGPAESSDREGWAGWNEQQAQASHQQQQHHQQLADYQQQQQRAYAEQQAYAQQQYAQQQYAYAQQQAHAQQQQQAYAEQQRFAQQGQGNPHAQQAPSPYPQRSYSPPGGEPQAYPQAHTQQPYGQPYPEQPYSEQPYPGPPTYPSQAGPTDVPHAQTFAPNGEQSAPPGPPSPSGPPQSPSMAPLANPVPGRWGSSAPKAPDASGRYSLSQPPAGPTKQRR